MRKTLKREYRIRSARDWIKTYFGNNIIKGYSKKYSVDKLCAIKELKMVGVEILEEYEKQLRQSLESLRQQRLSFKLKRENELNTFGKFDSDENFAMIIEYTSGEFPYGVTHEEMDEINNDNEFK